MSSTENEVRSRGAAAGVRCAAFKLTLAPQFAEVPETREGLDVTEEALDVCTDLQLFNGAGTVKVCTDTVGIIGFCGKVENFGNTEAKKAFLGYNAIAVDYASYTCFTSGCHTILFNHDVQQHVLNDLLEVRRVPAGHPAHPGFGLFAKADLTVESIFGEGVKTPCTRIPFAEYSGELKIDHDAGTAKLHSFVIKVPHHVDLLIDGEAEPRGLMAYLNGACDQLEANVGVKEIVCTGDCMARDGTRRPYGKHVHMMFHLLAPISAGQELIINYGPDYWASDAESDEDESDEDESYEDEPAPRATRAAPRRREPAPVDAVAVALAQHSAAIKNVVTLKRKLATAEATQLETQAALDTARFEALKAQLHR